MQLKDIFAGNARSGVTYAVFCNEKAASRSDSTVWFDLLEKASLHSLPTGIRLPVTTGLFRAAVYVIHTWFGLINILQCVVGCGDPGAVAVRHRIDRKLFEISRLDEVIERLRRLLLIGRIGVNGGAHDMQIFLQYGLFGRLDGCQIR